MKASYSGFILHPAIVFLTLLFGLSFSYHLLLKSTVLSFFGVILITYSTCRNFIRVDQDNIATVFLRILFVFDFYVLKMKVETLSVESFALVGVPLSKMVALFFGGTKLEQARNFASSTWSLFNWKGPSPNAKTEKIAIKLSFNTQPIVNRCKRVSNDLGFTEVQIFDKIGSVNIIDELYREKAGNKIARYISYSFYLAGAAALLVITIQALIASK